MRSDLYSSKNVLSAAALRRKSLVTSAKTPWFESPDNKLLSSSVDPSSLSFELTGEGRETPLHCETLSFAVLALLLDGGMLRIGCWRLLMCRAAQMATAHDERTHC